MKPMVLTGLGSEQDFRNGHSTNGTSYFLIFNGGELRVPISEDAAEVVIKGMYGSEDQASVEDPIQEKSPVDSSYNDDDVDQI